MRRMMDERRVIPGRSSEGAVISRRMFLSFIKIATEFFKS